MNLIRIILVLILILIIIWVSYIKEKRKISIERYSSLINNTTYNNYKHFDISSNVDSNNDNILEEVEILGEDIYKRDNKIQIKKGNHTINVDLSSEYYDLKEEESTINIRNYIDNKPKNINITEYVEKVSIFDGIKDLYYQFRGKYTNLSNGFFY